MKYNIEIDEDFLYALTDLVSNAWEGMQELDNDEEAQVFNDTLEMVATPFENAFEKLLNNVAIDILGYKLDVD